MKGPTGMPKNVGKCLASMGLLLLCDTGARSILTRKTSAGKESKLLGQNEK